MLECIATAEVAKTSSALADSVGWSLLMDGAAKGRYRRRMEAYIMHDIDSNGEVRERVLGITHCTAELVLELRKLGTAQRPGGAQRMVQRLFDLMISRYDSGVAVRADMYLPTSMEI